MSIYAIADDLSGAAETAAALAGLEKVSAHNAHRALPIAAVLDLYSAHEGQDPLPTTPAGSGRIEVVDSGNRHVAGPEAARRMRLLLAAKLQMSQVFLKFDSLLRGNIDVELAAAMESRPMAFCPALPGLDRTVRNGVLEVSGRPLHKTSLWQAESAVPDRSISARLPGTSPSVVPLDVVRSAQLESALTAITSEGRLAVCDAETAADLDRIAAAALRRGISLAGAAGLASAMARQSSSSPDTLTAPGDPARVSKADVLFILGTASKSTGPQLAELHQLGVPVHRLDPSGILSFDPGPVGPAAIIVEGPIDVSRSNDIVQSLAQLALRTHAGRHLVLSGGETARTVLDTLGITRLHPLAQAHPGAVVSVTDSGRLIATRPGSFGDRHSLAQILKTMHALENANFGKASS